MKPEEPKRIRWAAVAGRFYESDPGELRRDIEEMLARAGRPAGKVPKALIVPHAGYVFSGPIAASAYAQLLPARGTLKRVVLLGPAHFAAFDGVAASRAEIFATPLGEVPVDMESIASLVESGRAITLEQAHASEHSLEVQLPFLQVVLGEFRLVPLTVGQADDEEVSEVLQALWDGAETVLVISSDLSHYYESSVARRLDLATASAIEGLCPEKVEEGMACGGRPIRGLLRAAREHHLHAQTLDLRNSGDTAGPRDRVVGYGAFSFVPAEAATPGA